jgi:hypothetical protein
VITSRVVCVGCESRWCGAADATLIIIRENRQTRLPLTVLFPHALARLSVLLYLLPLNDDRACRRQGLVLDTGRPDSPSCVAPWDMLD